MSIQTLLAILTVAAVAMLISIFTESDTVHEFAMTTVMGCFGVVMVLTLFGQ